MRYYCRECDGVAEESDMKSYSEDGGRFIMCPYCSSEEVEEAVECDECQEEVPLSIIMAGYDHCNECHEHWMETTGAGLGYE